MENEMAEKMNTEMETTLNPKPLSLQDMTVACRSPRRQLLLNPHQQNEQLEIVRIIIIVVAIIMVVLTAIMIIVGY